MTGFPKVPLRLMEPLAPKIDSPAGRRGPGLTGLTVSRLKGRPFYGQAMGQLRLTCTFSAECAQPEGLRYRRLWRHIYLLPAGPVKLKNLKNLSSLPPLVLRTIFPPACGQCHLVKKKSESTCHFDVCFFLAYFFSC